MSKQIVLNETQMRAWLAARRDDVGGIEALANELETTRQNIHPMISQRKPVSKSIALKSGFKKVQKTEFELINGDDIKVCGLCKKHEFDTTDGNLLTFDLKKFPKGGVEYFVCSWCSQPE